jgi:tetratricopeptide (TPR) repeat protein
MESYLKRAEELKKQEKFEEALKQIDNGLKAFPGNEALLLKKASILIDSFDDVDAGFALLLTIERGFGHQSIADLKKKLGGELLLELYLLLTDCFRLKNDQREALNHALMAQKLAPKDQAAILALTTAYFELGNLEKAKSIFRTVKDEPRAESFWLLGQILCAEGLINEADEMFLAASLEDEGYHRPNRISEEEFVEHFNQALESLPKDIADFVTKHAVQLLDIVPLEMVKESRGHLIPTATMSIDKKTVPTIFFYQRNVENMVEENDFSELIASILLHGLKNELLNQN